MSTEKLIVQLQADTSELDGALETTDGKLNDLDESTKKTSTSFADFSKVAKQAAGLITVAAGAITALTAKTVQYAKELQVATNRNGGSVEQLQALAFAANTVGISLEKIGDIGKDTNEKIGEFLATGGGGFQDFADVLGLTENEANALASEFENLSGTDVLQEVVNRLEDAGASSEQVSFALEGLASDTTDLIPLLTDGGKAIKGLTKEFDELNVTLSQEDLNKITTLGVEFDKFTAKLSGESRQAVADYAEEIATAIKVTSEFLTTTGNVFNLIATGWGNVIAISQAAVTDLVNGTDTLSATLEARAKLSSEAIKKLADEAAEGAKRIAEGVDLSVPEVNNNESNNNPDEDSPAIQKINKEVEAIKDRFKTEEQLLAEKLEREEILLNQKVTDEKEREALKLELKQEYVDNIEAIEQEARDKKLEAEKKLNDEILKADRIAQRDKAKQVRIDDKIARDSERRDENIARNAMALASLVFEDNKAVSAGIAFVNTAQGVTKALSEKDFVSAALIAATGAVQISNILSASRGGGSLSSVPSRPATSDEPEFQPDSTSLEFSEQTGTEGNVQRFIMVDSSGNDLVEFVSNGINDMQRNGG